MNDYAFILDEMTWSYSRVSTYLTCPNCFLLEYILKKASVDGAFGQYGKFGHEGNKRYKEIIEVPWFIAGGQDDKN